MYWNSSQDIMYPYEEKARDIPSKIPIRLREFQRAKHKGTSEGKGVYFNIYPGSSPNMDSI